MAKKYVDGMTQQQRNALVLKRLLSYCEDADGAETLAESLDCMLDDLASQDFFGTERQSDPRGDARNRVFSMRCVEKELENV